jgi:hypothetical protein
MKDINISGGRLIGGLPLLIIMTLNGSSGIDLLDALIMYVAKLAG